MIYPDLYGEEGESKFPGNDFNQYWKECMEHGYLSERQQKEILSNCFAFTKETVRYLFSRFQEMDFILHHCSFVDPAWPKHKYVDIILTTVFSYVKMRRTNIGSILMIAFWILNMKNSQQRFSGILVAFWWHFTTMKNTVKALTSDTHYMSR